jgi:hypothetical protein
MIGTARKGRAVEINGQLGDIGDRAIRQPSQRRDLVRIVAASVRLVPAEAFFSVARGELAAILFIDWLARRKMDWGRPWAGNCRRSGRRRKEGQGKKGTHEAATSLETTAAEQREESGRISGWWTKRGMPRSVPWRSVVSSAPVPTAIIAGRHTVR